MSNESNTPVSPDRSVTRRRIILTAAVLAIALILFLAGRLLLNLGQRMAERVAGVEPTLSTATPFPATGTSTPTATQLPSPTATYEFPPTATQTKIPWTSCPGIVVSMTDTSAGEMVHILRCADGLEYDLGPLAKGVFAVSPDDKVFVYCDQSGAVYAARIGVTTMKMITANKHQFAAINRGTDPVFKLKFDGENQRILVVIEVQFDQKIPVYIPGWLYE